MPKYADDLEMKHYLNPAWLHAGVSCADGLHFTRHSRAFQGYFLSGRELGNGKHLKLSKKNAVT